MDWITLAIGAVKEFFGWKKVKEENLPGQQKHDEIQQIRTERDNEIEFNRQAVLRGIDPNTGELRPPQDK